MHNLFSYSLAILNQHIGPFHWGKKIGFLFLNVSKISLKLIDPSIRIKYNFQIYIQDVTTTYAIALTC